MSPAQAIASLDRQTRDHGEDIVLRRGTATVIARAKVSGYDAHELVGEITQQDSKVILSPSRLTAAGWPGAGNGSATPQQGDRVRVQGFNKIVQAATAVQLGGQTVRIEMRVRGEAS